jgi:heptosyltransferase-2
MVAPDSTQVSRLVIRAPNWLGDAVLALPAMAALRRHFSSARLTVAAVRGIAPMFREDTDVRPDDVVEFADLREERAVLARGGHELAILIPNSFRSAWMTKRAGIAARWGYPTAGRGLLLTRRSRPDRRHGVRHHADYFRDLVRGLGIPCGDEPPRLRASIDSAHQAATLLERRGVRNDARLIGFAPGAAYGEAKQWRPDRVAAVAARLTQERDATCLIVGASHDRAAARAIESWIRAHAPSAAARVVDLTGATSLATLIGLTARCRVFVSNDSGAMHVAAALGRPVVAIFGPTREQATRPIGDHDVLTADVFCRPCMLRDCPIDHRCMKRITTDQVFAAVSTRLAFDRTRDVRVPGHSV